MAKVTEDTISTNIHPDIAENLLRGLSITSGGQPSNENIEKLFNWAEGVQAKVQGYDDHDAAVAAVEGYADLFNASNLDSLPFITDDGRLVFVETRLFFHRLLSKLADNCTSCTDPNCPLSPANEGPIN